MFCTLKIENDVPNAKKDPIDVAQFARRQLLNNDEALEKRVLRNEGGHPFDVVNAITGVGSGDNDWMSVKLSRITIPPKYLAQEALGQCKECGPGLVLNFTISEEFRKAAGPKKTGMGYWKFDAVSVDCKGEFVSMNANNMCESEKRRLREIWSLRKKAVSDSSNQRQKKLPKNLFPGSPGTGAGSPSHTPRSSSSSTRNEHELQHAMVMLGGYQDDGKDDTPYIMLLNSWENMPLVLVSPEYLAACGATIWFSRSKLTSDTTVARKAGFVGMCGVPDQGADSSFVLSLVDHVSAPDI
jgi:hypothetical protein